ncbi:N-acetyltransferase [Streptomyces sulfonofaciens]|uniref:N-acetyltransferase n=1 Tax=Streptomyces sulfonofaciens TaxID=68272 RepID=A0A919G1U7_9ACTN|nr:GNAT family N-acetyltransferase [Streptomyces sulfonofaciens]GHH75645.1 N-acetyltransferase [Streptomyces sulfonofaciens]
MTTTLRPTEPLQHSAGGGRSRHYQVCVNSRGVGTLHLATHPDFGPKAAVIRELHIAEPDRGRGRGAVAVLAAEEVARGWGCTGIQAVVPAGAGRALGLATALGYTERGRGMDKPLDGERPVLPQGSGTRPMTRDEYGPWYEQRKLDCARSWMARGVGEAEAWAKSEADHTRFLPRGLDTEDTLLAVLEQTGEPVGSLWLKLADTPAFVLGVEVDEERRGRGHGRTLMLAAEGAALDAGLDRIGLHVAADNTTAVRLYESLGYRPTVHDMYKQLL